MKSHGTRRLAERQRRSYPFRGSLRFLSAVAVAMALATSAQATVFKGSVSFTPLVFPTIVVSGSGTGSSVAIAPKPGPGGLGDWITMTWTTGGATGPISIPLPRTMAAPITALRINLTAPGPCTFADPGSVLGGPCALGGTVSPMVGGGPFLIVPLSGLGVAGRISFGPYHSYIDAQSWATGTVPITVNGVTINTFNGAPAMMTGYDNRTGGGLGTVNLVAPAGLMSTLTGNWPVYVSMTLTFVPEPGTLLLLGLGVAGLAVVGRRRSAH